MTEHETQILKEIRDEIKMLHEAVQAIGGNPVNYNIRQAAEYLGCSTQWIRVAARNGVIPCNRVGRDIRFSKANLDAYKETPADIKIMTNLKTINE
ncbi:MAG: helix-turn-helix domain-containing protein [Chlorobiaceae bacterium]